MSLISAVCRQNETMRARSMQWRRGMRAAAHCRRPRWQTRPARATGTASRQVMRIIRPSDRVDCCAESSDIGREIPAAAGAAFSRVAQLPEAVTQIGANTADIEAHMSAPKAFSLLCLCVGMSACATTPSPAAMRVQDADSNMVHSCTFLGIVTGTSGWGGLVASSGEQNAENSAREKAAAIGANRIVWMTVNGGWAPNASGNAYRCPK